MSEAGKGKQWANRVRWAECSEPFKTQIDNYSTEWINGRKTHEQLAFDILSDQSKIDGSYVFVGDIELQLKILRDAMLATVDSVEYGKRKDRSQLRYEMLTSECSKNGQEPTRHR